MGKDDQVQNVSRFVVRETYSPTYTSSYKQHHQGPPFSHPSPHPPSSPRDRRPQVNVVRSKSEWETALAADEQLIVLDCFAEWCGPCKAISPKVAEFSGKYPTVRFYKIDVDELPEVAQELGVRAMPTFLLFKKGQKVDEVVGAIPSALERAITSNM